MVPEQKLEADIEAFNEFFGEEELDPELERYIDQSTVPRAWTSLRHPLVYVVPYTSSMNKMANRQLAHKKQALTEALEEKNWFSYIWLHERPYRPEAFAEIAWQIENDEEYWELLRNVWIDSENIWQWQEHVQMFLSDRPGRELLMTEDEQAILAALPNRLTVYRGWKADQGTDVGWSWTLSEEKARWFAQRFGGPGYITTGLVEKDDVVALFTGRNEQEIVVRPEDVHNIELKSW